MDFSELMSSGACDVVAWSSSHLSEDDSDGSDDASPTSQSPSQYAELDERDTREPRQENIDDLEDECDLEVDLPRRIQLPAPSTLRERQRVDSISNSIGDIEAKQDEEIIQSADFVKEKIDSVRVESSPSKSASQIPRLVPPLIRGTSLRTELPLSRFQRSPSKTESLGNRAQEKPSANSVTRREQSVYAYQASDFNTKRPSIATTGQGLASTSSKFWANQQNRHSSRLLDDWKRKEIWHDFKRAEENFTSLVLSTTNGAASELSNHAQVEHPNDAFNQKKTNRSSFGDLINPIDSGTSIKQGAAIPLRRSISFAMKTNASLEKARTSEGGDSSAGPNTCFIDSTAPAQMCTTLSPVPHSTADYDRLIDDQRRLTSELESCRSALIAEQESSRIVHDRLVNLENVDRENRFLKEEIQKHVMQELSTKELIRTLEDQLALTARSEDQLKMQTRQLMQQNQALQADLLEKMAGETGKIQQLAQLSVELQNLRDELQRKETKLSQTDIYQRNQTRMMVLRQLISRHRAVELRCAFRTWQETFREQVSSYSKGATAITEFLKRLQIKIVARAFRRMNLHTHNTAHVEHATELTTTVASYRNRFLTISHRAGALILSYHFQKRAWSYIHVMWKVWVTSIRKQILYEHNLGHGLARLRAMLQAHSHAWKQRAFSAWVLQASLDGQRLSVELAKKAQSELVEAKECVFLLSRAKARLEEKLQISRQEVQHNCEQLEEHRSELQLVKHGFVSLIIRSIERQWTRAIFDNWRQRTHVETCAKEYRLQLEKAEFEAEERKRYAQSLGDYNNVLRNDLERYQFFSQDKRIAVDVLAKKLLREEERLKQMEEQQVGLEEKVEAYKTQLSSIVEWRCGVYLPVSLLHLCRDATIENLRGLFSFIANRHVSSDPTVLEGTESAIASRRLPSDRIMITSLIEFLSESNALGDSLLTCTQLVSVIQNSVPEYAPTQGITIIDFIACLNALAKEAFDGLPTAQERVRSFWSVLLHRCSVARQGLLIPISHREAVDVSLHAARSPWAGQLTDDIIQNQEKLLAVLEHETAVAERAVMEKASLKHTYSPSEHSSTSTVKEFQEYQCEPVIPPDSQPRKTQFVGNGLANFIDWHLTGQVRDLFLAFRFPIERVMGRYSSETRDEVHGNQLCLPISGVVRMLEDLRLYPAYVSSDLVHYHFGRLCDRDGVMMQQTLPIFLGYCALELFAKSLPTKSTSFRLSAREILLSFFCDLGFLGESDIPTPPRICLVGADVEMVVWPLFEYYSISEGASKHNRDDKRVGMAKENFAKFAVDIVNTAASAAERLFIRVLNETRRVTYSTGEPPQEVLHLDEFYIALAYLQAERYPNVQYANLGEAVRHWMQQSQ